MYMPFLVCQRFFVWQGWVIRWRMFYASDTQTYHSCYLGLRITSYVGWIHKWKFQPIALGDNNCRYSTCAEHHSLLGIRR